MYVCEHVRMCACMYACMYACMLYYAYMYVRMNLLLYLMCAKPQSVASLWVHSPRHQLVTCIRMGVLGTCKAEM